MYYPFQVDEIIYMWISILLIKLLKKNKVSSTIHISFKDTVLQANL